MAIRGFDRAVFQPDYPSSFARHAIWRRLKERPADAKMWLSATRGLFRRRGNCNHV